MGRQNIAEQYSVSSPHSGVKSFIAHSRKGRSKCENHELETIDKSRVRGTLKRQWLMNFLGSKKRMVPPDEKTTDICKSAHKNQLRSAKPSLPSASSKRDCSNTNARHLLSSFGRSVPGPTKALHRSSQSEPALSSCHQTAKPKPIITVSRKKAHEAVRRIFPSVHKKTKRRKHKR